MNQLVPTPVEYSNQLILTTEQLAEIYETDTDNIKKNFSNHKDKFIEGKHYYFLKGESLRLFKENLQVNDIPLQISNMTRSLYLWTEQGASRHCKILDTDMAWCRFDLLEESYFNKDKQAQPQLDDSLSANLQMFNLLYLSAAESERRLNVAESKISTLENKVSTLESQSEPLLPAPPKGLLEDLFGIKQSFKFSDLEPDEPEPTKEYYTSKDIGGPFGLHSKTLHKWLITNKVLILNKGNYRFTKKFSELGLGICKNHNNGEIGSISWTPKGKEVITQMLFQSGFSTTEELL